MITKGLQSINLVENSSGMCGVMLLPPRVWTLGDFTPFCCHSACKFGSDAISMIFTARSGRADQSCLKEIDLCSAVHLSLDELEFGDPRSEGADQAVARAWQSREQD